MIKSIAKYTGVALGVGLMSLNAQAGSWVNDAAGGFSMNNLYVPATTSPKGEGRSLMIVLHGCTQPISNFKTANLEDVAEEYGMVISVPDAKEKQGYSCWGYWDSTINRNYKDYKRVINLAEEYIEDSSLDIDPNQVYVAGLSSGGAFAMTVGCLAPDIFAGMGLMAAPSTGTSSNGAFAHEGTVASVTKDCKKFAGGYSEAFETQITSTAYGSSDYLVPKTYGQQNADVMAGIYGVNELSGTNTIETGVTETLWGGDDDKNRVSMLELGGVSHAWPGGSGASGSYIDSSSINYAMYLGEFFLKNNMRIEEIPCEGLECVKVKGLSIDAPEGGSTVNVSANIELPEIVVNHTTVVTVDGDAKEVAGSVIDEDFSISQGDHTVSIVVTAYDANNNEVVVEKTSGFNNEKKVEVPSWCSYIPAEYWHYVPACAAGL